MANSILSNDLTVERASTGFGERPLAVTDHPRRTVDTETVWIEEQARHFTAASIVRFLVALWLLPAAGQILVGLWSLSSPGGGLGRDARNALAVGRVWAVLVVLAMPTALAIGRWILRDWEQLPTVRGLGRARVHGVGLVVAFAGLAVAAVAGLTVPELVVPVLVLVASAAAVAGLVVPRWLAGGTEPGSTAIAWLALVVFVDLTVGWLHLLTFGPFAAVALIIEGVALAGVALLTVRDLGPVAQPAVTA